MRLRRWPASPRPDARDRLRRLLVASRRPALEALEDRALPSVTVNVDAAAGRHAINPNIYGVAYADTATLSDLNAPLNRYGGNNATRYNWQQNADNRGSDYYFESIGDASSTPGGRADTFISGSKAAGAQAEVTVPTLGWVAKLGPNRSKLAGFSVAKYGAQQGTDPWFPDAGNGVLANGQDVTGNNPNDADVPADATFEKGWIQHLVATWGTAANGGQRYYILDNEPSLWQDTHRDVHPVGATMDEVVGDIETYAAMIKSVDPSALVVGPEEWGWSGYFYSGYDQQYGSRHGWSNLPDRAAHGGMDYLPYVLQQLRQHDAATGQRSLDVFTVHYYPQGGEFGNDVSAATQLLRNQSTRSLWDPNYVDRSWINDKVDLIPRLKGWVAAYDPGLQVGITEYNWGAEGHMNGATTQADVLGIFGREGLDLANRWTAPAAGSPTYLAEKLYRNYDGNNDGFGDTGVAASAPNPDQVSAFASVRSADGALTVVVDNKNLYDPNNPSATTTVTINLANFNAAGVAQGWQLAAVNPSDQSKAAIVHLADLHFSGGSFTVTVPQQSVTLFVLGPAAAAPAGALEFSAAAYAANENAGTATVTVTRTGGSAGAVTVRYATADGTGVAGVNYVATSGVLAFAAGQTSATFPVTLLDDGTVNGDRTVSLTLAAPGGGATLGAPAAAVLTVHETDLTSDERFVRGLYSDFLGRPGTQAEWDFWAGQLPAEGRGGVAAGIGRSAEALGRVANALYLRLLDRAADPGGLSVWVGQLRAGATEEQVTADIAASAEFGARADALIGGTNHDANFVAALYQLLLRRAATAAEINAWMPAVAGPGRAAVAAGFLGSGEFRADAVRTLYGDPTQAPLPWEPWLLDLLRRTAAPSAAELNGWASGPADLLSIELAFSGSAEYYAVR